jgi:uncharacterized protein YlxP (DUF503 family)
LVAVHVAALSLDLHLPHAHSLKDKRAVIKPIVEGCQRRFRVAAAEVDHQDRWQRAGLGVAAVSATPRHVADVLDEVERFVLSFPEVEVVACERRWLDTAE